MIDQVLVPKDFVIKAIRFLDASAGEGFVFDPYTPQELDAATILYDWLQNDVPSWLPDDIKENWK